jgi:hypothetical protein
MSCFGNYLLHSVGSQLCHKLSASISQGYRPKIIKNLRCIFLGNKCDIRAIDTLKLSIASMEIIAQMNEIFFNNMPALFDKETIEAIKSWSSVRFHVSDNV